MSNNSNEFREARLLFSPPRATRKTIVAFINGNEEPVLGGRDNFLGSPPDSQAWPALPGGGGVGSSVAPELVLGLGVGSGSWGSPPSCWSRRRNIKFSLGEMEWPSLEARRGSNPDLLGGKSPTPSNGPGGGAERVDILGIKGPTPPTSTHEQLSDQDDVVGVGFAGDSQRPSPSPSPPDGGVASSSSRRGGAAQCKGWMRLPPIVMPSKSHSDSSSPASDSSSPPGHQQQQKRLKNNDSEERTRFESPRAARDGGAGQPAELPPVYLMLNKDFVVISPLKENLLLTLALTQKRPTSPSRPDVLDSYFLMQGYESEPDLGTSRPESESESESEFGSPPGPASQLGSSGEVVEGKRLRRHVFVGRFEAFSSFVRFGLGRDALRVATEANAGGTSTISESLSVEYFVRKFQAKDVVTEMEVEYCAMNWKKVDYICSLYEQRVGVSVTRAMSYPNPEDFSPQMAYRLLHKKLFGLVVARHGVTERHSFSQCILHVWCETTTTAKLLEDQYKQVSEELDITDDVIMVLTVAEGWHARPIFYESCLDRS